MNNNDTNSGRTPSHNNSFTAGAISTEPSTPNLATIKDASSHADTSYTDSNTHDSSGDIKTNTTANHTEKNHFNNSSGQGGHLELLEERPVVNKERLDVGKVTVTKHTRTKTITVPIELIEEYITVETQYSDEDSKALLTGNYDDKDIVKHVDPTLDSHAVVTINGNKVQLGDAPVEIIISRQVAIITKDTHVIQEVGITKTTHVHTDTIPVTLQHEKLEVFEEGFLDHKDDQQLKK